MIILCTFQVEVFKDPITDKGKQSKKGNLTLVRNYQGMIQTKKREEVNDSDSELLVEVFKDGKLIRDWTFEEVQKRVSDC